MTQENEYTKAKQIRKLLAIMISAMLAAILLAVGMLYRYNPSGIYLAKNVLLAPESLPSLRYSEGNQRLGTASRFAFSNIEFMYFDVKRGKWEKKAIEAELYSRFYEMIADRQSLGEVSQDIINLFNTGRHSLLTINVQQGSVGSDKDSVKFLQASFAPEGDYFRILLRSHGTKDHWVYFHYPGIYQNVLNLFTDL